MSNHNKKITNWGREISNRGRDYKSDQEELQSRAGITNQCRTPLLIVINVFENTLP